jgi:hypothetical protein
LFGGGSGMVWGGITALVVVARNLTGIRYRDEIVQPYVIPFIQAQTNNITFQQDNARPHVALHGGKHENGHHCCLGEIGIHL